MIFLENVTHLSGSGRSKRQLLTSVTLAIPSDRKIALIAASEEDKNEFINLICDVTSPLEGKIIRSAHLSFPPNLPRAFDGTLSLRHNLQFIARLYGADEQELIQFVKHVTKFGPEFDHPYSSLPYFARRQLGYIIAYSVSFDVYVANEPTFHAGPSDLKEVALALFELRARTSGIVLAVKDARTARQYCDMALVLRDGKAELTKNLEQAISDGNLKNRSLRSGIA